MGIHKSITADPLFAGFYSVSDAARLLSMQKGKARDWLNGRGANKQGVMIDRDFPDTPTLSFLDLMEMRFIEYFRRQGVSMQTLRKASEKARMDWDAKHPFALSKAQYLTDRRNIFAQVAEQEGDEATWNLATGQMEMWELIEAAIAKGIVFDATTDLASLWKPRQADFPSVVLDPKRAFGKPIVEAGGVPTSALVRQWRAERGDARRVAKWFDIEESEVAQAVEFEMIFAG
jgi:uncharacterized protein (DUF433 family)